MSDAPGLSDQQAQWFKEIREEQNRRGRPNGPWVNGEDKSEKGFVGPARIDFASSLHIPIQPRTWLDRHRLLRKNTAFQLNGDGGIGKTEISLQMMVGMCATGSMFNLPVDRGPCLFVSFEEPENEIRWRIDHLCHAFDIPSNGVKNLEILDLTKVRDPWMFKERNRELIPQPAWTWLRKQYEQVKPMFVAMDNKTRFFGANQNDAVLTTSYAHEIELACCDHDTTIMPLAHVSLSQLESGRGDSGSVAAGNAFRSRMLFGHADPKRPEDEDEGARKLTVMKANATPTGHFLEFQWHKGLEFFDCLYKPPVAGSDIGTVDKAERVVMNLMRLFEQEKLFVSNNSRSPYYAPNLFIERKKNCEGVPWKGLKAAMQNLIHKGELKIVTTGPPSKPVTHLEIT